MTEMVNIPMDQVDRVHILACDLLVALHPWASHGPAVSTAATKLTLALAMLGRPTGAETEASGPGEEL